MLEIWLPILACMVLAATWYHVLRLRERATTHARRLCERHGLQLLDDSVGLHRLRVHWRRGALHTTREYRFETSRGGDDRQPATLTVRAGHVVASSLPAVDEAPPAPAHAATSPFVSATLPRSEPGTGNVVPIRRARRTLH